MKASQIVATIPAMGYYKATYAEREALALTILNVILQHLPEGADSELTTFCTKETVGVRSWYTGLHRRDVNEKVISFRLQTFNTPPIKLTGKHVNACLERYQMAIDARAESEKKASEQERAQNAVNSVRERVMEAASKFTPDSFRDNLKIHVNNQGNCITIEHTDQDRYYSHEITLRGSELEIGQAVHETYRNEIKTLEDARRFIDRNSTVDNHLQIFAQLLREQLQGTNLFTA